MKIYKFATMTFKQLKSKLLAIMSLGIIFYAGIGQANAQCTPTYTGNTCVGDGITFFASTPGAYDIEWYFYDDPAKDKDLSNNKTVTYSYPSPGTYTVRVKLKYGGGIPCEATVKITVFAKPTANLVLESQDTQCFESNQFCFKDLSAPTAGSKIVRVRYLFDDGELIVEDNPVFPRVFCKSFTNRSGGTYGVTIELEDRNGCIRKVYYKDLMVVHPKINPRFTSNYPKGCDSVLLILKNTTPLAKANIKSFKWVFGDGTFNTTDWANPTPLEHWYRTPGPNNGSFPGALIIETNYGCSDTFKIGAMAQNFILNPIIVSDKDSACVSEPEFKFKLKDGPIPGVGAGGYVWNFGDNCANPQNKNNRTWTPSWRFGTGPRAFLVSLTFKHPVCPAKTIYDTIMILGPVSTIEIPFERVLENEVYQCQGDKPVQFVNHSTFYHNDNNFWDDDSSVYWNGTELGHIFDSLDCASAAPAWTNGALMSLKPQLRNKDNVFRLWEFGDNAAPQCTTDSRYGVNIGMNCNFSQDSLPIHKYPSWDSVYTFDRAGRPYEISVFDRENDTCYPVQVFADDTICTIKQYYTVFGSGADARALAQTEPYKSFGDTINRGKDIVKAPFEQLVLYGATVKINAGNKLLHKKKGTFTWITITGPKTVTIPKEDTIRLIDNDSFQYLVDTFTLERRIESVNMPDSLRSYITGCDRNPAIQPGDSISPEHHSQLFYERDVRCFTVTLTHQDTVHPLMCKSVSTKQIAHGKGVPKKMSSRGGGPSCLFSPTQDYKTVFSLADTKPGCSQQHMWMNFDSASNPDAWVDFKTIIFGTETAKSGGIPYAMIAPYQKGGNYPATYNKTYRAAEIKDRINGRVTVGLIIGNGTDTLGNPMCIDTVWYRQELRFPILDATFNVVIPREHDNTDPAYVSHICRGDSVMLKIPPIANLTNPNHVDLIFWKFFTLSAGPTLTDQHEIEVLEEIIRMEKIKGDAVNRYNYLIRTKTIRSQITGKPVINTTSDPDTLLTAKYSKWFKVANYDKVYEEVKTALKDDNFDIYELSGADIARMIDIKCIDTTGFGQFITYTFEPDTSGAFTIYDRRDSSIFPNDTFEYKPGEFRDSVMVFITKVAGQYNAQLKLEGRGCEVFMNRKINVGFWQKLDLLDVNGDGLEDSVLCHNTEPRAIVQYRYWEKFPETSTNNPPQLDPIAYWRDGNRIIAGNKEQEPRWDWSINDDDDTKPLTKFGPPDYGAIGIGFTGVNGNEKSLGGGNIYYKSYGAYLFRVATRDTMGCRDTISKRVYITDVQAKFNLDLAQLNCKSFVELFDSSKVFDPCQDSFGYVCDKIVRWQIIWGDGKQESDFYPFKPNKIGHDYTRNGIFEIKMIVTTELGCKDSITKIVEVPGPQPDFEFVTTNRICARNTVSFLNTSIGPSDTAKWLWDFGDGQTLTQEFSELGDTIKHTYDVAGEYDVFLTEFDYIPGTNRQCPGIYPDTIGGGQQLVKVFVKAWDSVDIISDKQSICPDDSVTFTAITRRNYAGYKWTFEKPIDALTDTLTTQDSIAGHVYRKGGKYWAYVTQILYTTEALPHCPGTDSIEIYVDTVRAFFTIDSIDKPKYCFKDGSANADQIDYEYKKNGQVIGSSGDANPCEKFDTGTYTICQYVVSPGGCKDTFCTEFTYNFTSKIKLYNTFTPGKGSGAGDGFNSVYDVEIFGHALYRLRIYNRWNQKIFESESEDVDWNGKVNNDGALCPDGTYYYQFEYRMIDEEEDVVHKAVGSITLIREK